MKEYFRVCPLGTRRRRAERRDAHRTRSRLRVRSPTRARVLDTAGAERLCKNTMLLSPDGACGACSRRAPAPDRSHGARLADSQRASYRRARQLGPHQPRDRADSVRHRTHRRGSPHHPTRLGGVSSRGRERWFQALRRRGRRVPVFTPLPTKTSKAAPFHGGNIRPVFDASLLPTALDKGQRSSRFRGTG